MTLLTVALWSVWILNSIYFFALLPQIRLNYKLKSTKGLNDLMLLMYLVGYITDTIYVFTLHLPLGYKVFVPAGLCATMAMIVQRNIYARGSIPTQFKNNLMLIMVCSAALLVGAWFYPLQLGYICGWISIILFGTYQIPQLIQVYKRKSVEGLSLLFILTLFIGTALELFASIVIPLPLPSLITGIRGVIIYSLFLVFFYLYRTPRQKEQL